MTTYDRRRDGPPKSTVMSRHLNMHMHDISGTAYLSRN